MPAQQRFEGRTVIVTGGANGIGFATAKAYAAERAAVVIADIDDDRLGRAAAELGVDGFRADLSQEADVEDLVAHALDRHGRIDVLVNLASIFPLQSIEQETLAGWKRVLAANLDSTFLCCQKVLPHMRGQGYGRIVTTSSGSVLNGQAGAVAYVSTKGGVIAFTRSLAREVGQDGITANVIMPGLIATAHVLQMFGDGPQAAELGDAVFRDAIGHQAVKRRGEPQDLAHGILFLTEAASGFITGQTLNVDGGYSFV